jgi:hypothetical protein
MKSVQEQTLFSQKTDRVNRQDDERKAEQKKKTRTGRCNSTGDDIANYNRGIIV